MLEKQKEDLIPTYAFRNKETGEEFTEFMSISELDAYKEAHPELEQTVNGGPMLIDPFRLGRVKPTPEFREKLNGLKKAHPLGTWSKYSY